MLPTLFIIVESSYRVLHICTNSMCNVACDNSSWLSRYTTTQVHKYSYLCQNMVYIMLINAPDPVYYC